MKKIYLNNRVVLMKYVIYGINLFNYIILITWISLSLNRMSEVGPDIVSFLLYLAFYLLFH